MGVTFSKVKCLQCGERVGWVGVVVNVVMVVLKTIVGVTSGSKACLADALHSGTNIVTALAIFVSRRLTGRPADERHTYGLGKVEFVSAGLVSVLILAFTLTVVIASFKHLLYEAARPPHPSALLVAVTSIITNEIMFRYFRCVGTELRSQTIIANAWANRADCFSSMAVVVGVIGGQLGFHHLDPIAALVVAGIIAKVCIGCMREAVAGLMDRSVSREALMSLRKIIKDVEEVQGIKSLRARLLGDRIWVDVAVKVASTQTMRECEHICKQVQQRIADGVHGVGKVQVEFDTAL